MKSLGSPRNALDAHSCVCLVEAQPKSRLRTSLPAGSALTRGVSRGLAFARSERGVEGIVNGMDIDEWNPKTDKYLTVPYDHTNVYSGKAAAKEALQVRPKPENPDEHA